MSEIIPFPQDRVKPTVDNAGAANDRGPVEPPIDLDRERIRDSHRILKILVENQHIGDATRILGLPDDLQTKVNAIVYHFQLTGWMHHPTAVSTTERFDDSELRFYVQKALAKLPEEEFLNLAVVRIASVAERLMPLMAEVDEEERAYQISQHQEDPTTDEHPLQPLATDYAANALGYEEQRKREVRKVLVFPSKPPTPDRSTNEAVPVVKNKPVPSGTKNVEKPTLGSTLRKLFDRWFKPKE